MKEPRVLTREEIVNASHNNGRAHKMIINNEWTDRAVIMMAKVALRHSNRQITQISDDLHFPTASFFCKFFKRMAGCTPMEYRQSSKRKENNLP